MEGNEVIVRRFFEEAFNRGRLEAIDELVAPTFVEHQAMGPGAPTGRAAPRAIVESLRRAFEDFRIEVEDIVERGDRVWVRLHATGTHTGTFLGRAATGRRISITVIDILRLAAGKIVEHWGVADRMTALQQIQA